MKNFRIILLIAAANLSEAFVVPPREQQVFSSQSSSLILSDHHPHAGSATTIHHRRHHLMTRTVLQLQNMPSEENSDSCWSPGLRRVMGGIASLGVVETCFLTWNKFFNGQQALPFCSESGGGSTCSDVLNGPYAQVPFTEIPLSAVGFMAYLTVVGLAVFPLLITNTASESSDSDDTTNRVLLMGVTTAMGTFSIFLLTLLFGVLHQDCPYCELSATFSILLAFIAWIGGCLPEENQEMAKKGAQMTASGFMTSTVFAISLFVFADDPTAASALGDFGSTSPSTILASAEKNAPPPIESPSSDRAMSLANELQALDAKMFGAFWCSHCYDQKETLGKQAMSKIPYIECSKDGKNSQNALCKSKEVPGYPTWEINGKLYPGEQSLEELEEVIAEVKKGMASQ